MTNKIYSIHTIINQNDWHYNVKEVNVVEKGKINVTQYNGEVSKDEFLKITSAHDENTEPIRFNIYCLENDIELAKHALTNHITSKIHKYRKSLDVAATQFISLTQFLKNDK